MMKKNLCRIIAGSLSLLFVGQVMIFGDGSGQGVLHADTIAYAAEAIEEAKNAEQLAAEFDAATQDLGEIDYFSVPQISTMSLEQEETTESGIDYADELTVTGYVQKGVVPNASYSNPEKIYVRIYNGDWAELAYTEVDSYGFYEVSASGSDVYHVKFECNGFLPFYLKDYGTGAFLVGSGDSVDTVTLVPGDTTYNEQSANSWSDDALNGNDLAYVQSCFGANRGNTDFNPSMDADGDGVVSQPDLDAFCAFYETLGEEGFELTDDIMRLDINLDGVINNYDYNILYGIVYEGADHSACSLPDLANADGYFTEDDLIIFGDYVASARDAASGVYLYNHEMTGDVIVNIDDYYDGLDKINTDAQKREASENYYPYMDVDNNGTIDSTDIAWFEEAYKASGDLYWDNAFKRTLTVLANAEFPYSFNLHDTNLNLNGCALHVKGYMSFTTDMPQFWTGGQGATLDINHGYLEVDNNLVFRTASPDGWGCNAGQLMNLNGGTVVIENEFQFGQDSCYDTVLMTNQADMLMIGGNWIYNTLTDMEGKWTAGQIWFLGENWNVNENSGNKAIFSSGTQTIYFGNPNGKQTVIWDNDDTYINNVDNTRNTERTFNFDYVDENGYCLGVQFLKDFTAENYWFRPWWRPYDEPDYTLYRKGWEIGSGVHIATGNYTKSFTDLSVTSPGVTSDFVRTYNSTSTEEGSFGLGWDFNIDVSRIVIPAAGYYQVVLPDGSNTTFKEVASGVFECLNAHSTMVRNGNEYTITNAAQSQYHFNASGELDWVKDANGNQLTISSKSNNQRIVTDSTGRTYTIKYTEINGKSRIESIEDTVAGRIVTYAYNSNAQLISATSVSGGTEYYEYNENGRLYKITNCYGEVTDEINYNSDNTVNWLTNAAGLKQVYTYDKPQHQTGLKEYDGDKLVKTFTYEYDEKYAVKTNTVETDGQTYEVDKIIYNMVDGENKYDEMSESVDIMGNVTRYDRDASGNVIKTTNPDGTYTLASYNNKNMPLVQVDESKNVVIYEYDASGVNVEKQYQSLAPVSNADAIVNNPSLADYTEYALTEYTYHPASDAGGIHGQVHTITDPEGNVTMYTYGSSDYEKGLPVQKIIMDGNTVINTVEYEYNSQLQVSKEITSVDIAGGLYSVKEYEYDKFNNVTKVSDYGTGSTAAVTITEYDLLSRKTAEYTPNFSASKSHGSTYTYYPSGAVRTQTDALGNNVSYNYDAYGNVTETTNPDGTVAVKEYDGLQREIATYVKIHSSAEKQILTQTGYEFVQNNGFDVYTAMDAFESKSCSGLKTTKITYISAEQQVISETMADFRGNTVTEKINDKTKRTNAYYANGQLARQADALGNTTKYEYAYLNKLTKTCAPFHGEQYSITINEYDKNGNVILTKQTVQKQDSSEAKYSITQNQYNALGLLTQVTLSGSDSSEKNISQYFYNNAGIQTEMRTGLHDENDSEYLTTSYYYDAWNRLVRTEDSTDYNSGTVTYDLNGNVLTTTDANGNITTNTYDALNRVIASESVHPTDASKNVSMTYTYDNMGRLTETTSNDLTTSYTYDALGRKVTEAEYRNDYSTFKGFFYVGVSQYVKQQIVGINNMLMYSNTGYVYDDEMRIIEVTENGTATVSYTYDVNGNKASETLANGVTSTYTYNNGGRITHIQNTSVNMPISEYEYSYYLDGSDACKTRTENGIMEVTSYEYDSLKRLTSESVTTGGTTDTYTYKYDDYGNRAEMTVTGSENYTTVYSYNDSQGKYKALLMSESKTSADETPLPGFTTTAEKTTYTYDKNGSQLTKTTSEKTETNTYNAVNQLVGFTDGETTASYAYNASGLRYEKTVNGETVHHVWDGNQQIIADVVESQFYEANCYIRGTNLVATYHYQNGAKSDYTYYVQNAHGDVVNLTDADGAVTKTYHYDAFGVELDPTTGDVNVFRYCGEYFDTETGTVYLRARYYQAAIGRFTQRDSVAGKLIDPLSLNLYTYAHNNPILHFDPSGHRAKLISEIKKEIPKHKICHKNADVQQKNVRAISSKMNESKQQIKSKNIGSSSDIFPSHLVGAEYTAVVRYPVIEVDTLNLFVVNFTSYSNNTTVLHREGSSDNFLTFYAWEVSNAIQKSTVGVKTNLFSQSSNLSLGSSTGLSLRYTDRSGGTMYTGLSFTAENLSFTAQMGYMNPIDDKTTNNTGASISINPLFLMGLIYGVQFEMPEKEWQPIPAF